MVPNLVIFSVLFKKFLLWLWLWLKYNIAEQPYCYWWSNNGTMPHLLSYVYYCLKRKTLRCQLCSTHYRAHYTAVQINNYFKRTSAIKVTTMKITDENGSYHISTTKSTLFVESKDEWDIKEGTGKPMKNALHVQRYSKRHLSGWSNVKQQKKSSR